MRISLKIICLTRGSNRRESLFKNAAPCYNTLGRNILFGGAACPPRQVVPMVLGITCFIFALLHRFRNATHLPRISPALSLFPRFLRQSPDRLRFRPSLPQCRFFLPVGSDIAGGLSCCRRSPTFSKASLVPDKDNVRTLARGVRIPGNASYRPIRPISGRQRPS